MHSLPALGPPKPARTLRLFSTATSSLQPSTNTTSLHFALPCQPSKALLLFHFRRELGYGLKALYDAGVGVNLSESKVAHLGKLTCPTNQHLLDLYPRELTHEPAGWYKMLVYDSKKHPQMPADKMDKCVFIFTCSLPHAMEYCKVSEND